MSWDEAPVLDVDSHFEPVADWLDEFPSLKAKVPPLLPDDDPRFRMDSPEQYAWYCSDDLLRGVPRERRMPIGRLTTPTMRALYDPARRVGLAYGYPGAEQHQPLVDPLGRVAWLDANGIVMQNIITGTGYGYTRAISDPALGMEVLSALNRWMGEAAAPSGGRLAPVACLRFEDLDWVVAEMTRARERGSRAFLLPSEPTGDVPPCHPDYDRVWDAAVDLGMVALVHVGLSPAIYHPAWANTENPGVIRLISTLQPHQQALVFLNAMVFEGVFERHPRLTVLFSEHGIDWVGPAVARMDALATPGVSPLLMGEDYSLPLRPGEYVRRNVRVSPLPRENESPLDLLEALPEVPVFSSDYPHFEGCPSPVAFYADRLGSVASGARASFLGGSIADCYARMGDPIAA